MKYGFHPQAEIELHEAAEWYDREVPGLVADFAKEFDRALSRLLDDPLHWRQIQPGVRRCLLKRFPYAIIYDLPGDMLRIIAVAHLHRKPGYWRDRIS
jgi:hypothetical protein